VCCAKTIATVQVSSSEPIGTMSIGIVLIRYAVCSGVSRETFVVNFLGVVFVIVRFSDSDTEI